MTAAHGTCNWPDMGSVSFHDLIEHVNVSVTDKKQLYRRTGPCSFIHSFGIQGHVPQQRVDRHFVRELRQRHRQRLSHDPLLRPIRDNPHKYGMCDSRKKSYLFPYCVVGPSDRTYTVLSFGSILSIPKHRLNVCPHASSTIYRIVRKRGKWDSLSIDVHNSSVNCHLRIRIPEVAALYFLVVL